MNPVESDIFPFVTLMNDYKSKRQLHLVILKWKVRYVSRIICQPCDLRMIVVSTMPSRIMLYCASFESYIRQNFRFFPLLTSDFNMKVGAGEGG